MNRKCCFWGLLLLCIAVSVPAHGEWQRAVVNYDRHAYGAANQNWGLQQSDNGWIYAANNRGLLEFDGSGWTLYPMRDAKARAIKAGDDGRMYIGGIGQFGYFEPDGLGGLGYVCLSDSLPGRSTVGVVWRIWQGREEVCFQSDRCLYLWNGRRLRQIDYEGEIYTSAILYGSFYIGTAEGVMKLEGDRFTLLPGSEGLGRLADLLPYRGQILVVTRFNGIYSYDGTGVRPYACAADPFMRGNPIFCAALDGALLALGSVQGGVCLLDLEKDAMNVVSIHNGLQNQTVLGLFFDARHDLWLGLDNGIDCLRLSSPVFSLYGDKPYIGSGYSSVLYKGSLYLGTNQGLFKTGFPAGRISSRKLSSRGRSPSSSGQSVQAPRITPAQSANFPAFRSWVSMASIRRGFSPMSSRKRSFPRVSISQGVPREAHTRVRLPPHRTPSARPGARGTGTGWAGR